MMDWDSSERAAQETRANVYENDVVCGEIGC